MKAGERACEKEAGKEARVLSSPLLAQGSFEGAAAEQMVTVGA